MSNGTKAAGRVADCARELADAIREPDTPEGVVSATSELFFALAAFLDELGQPLGFLSEYRSSAT